MKSSNSYVVVVPGTSTKSWLAALRLAAEKQGMAYIEDWGVDENLYPAGNALVVVWTTEPPLVGDPVVVIASDPQDAIEGCTSFYGVTPEEGMRLASRRYSFASSLIDRGAILCRPGEEVSILGLGEVQIPRNSVLEGREGPLQMFKDLPPVAGRGARWDPDLLWEATNPVRPLADETLDLTGRSRLLVFGPFIMLPRGRWKIRLNLEVRIATSPIVLGFEWGAEDPSVDDFSFDRSGVYLVEIEHEWAEEAVAQLKIILRQATFSGYLKIINIHCELSTVAGESDARDLTGSPLERQSKLRKRSRL